MTTRILIQSTLRTLPKSFRITSRVHDGLLLQERDYQLSACLAAGQIWRKKLGQAANPNAYGPLTDGPDYSFIDGRPTPPGSGKLKRAATQLELSNKIVELSKEIDFAVENHDQRLKQEEERKAWILGRKLKPKGQDDA